jgi:hypothetical protein
MTPGPALPFLERRKVHYLLPELDPANGTYCYESAVSATAEPGGPVR